MTLAVEACIVGLFVIGFLSGAWARGRRLKGEIAEAHARTQTTEASLQNRTSRLEGADARIAGLEAQLRQAGQQLEALQEQFEAERKSHAQTESELRQDLAEIADCSAILAENVQTAIDDSDSAVSALADAFQSLANRASDLDAKAIQAVNGDREESVSQTAGLATSTMNEVIGHMLASARITAAVAQKMQQFESLGKQLQSMITAITSIADDTNVLALNASIESARYGMAGAGFDVISKEVRKLAGLATDSASRAKETVHAVTSLSEGLCLDLIEAVTTSRDEALSAQQRVIILMSNLREADHVTQTTVQALSEEGKGIGRDVNAIVLSLQYHDLLRQRLQHIHDPLAGMGARHSDSKHRVKLAVGTNPYDHGTGSASDSENITLF